MVTKYFINISYYLLFLNYQNSTENTLNGYRNSKNWARDMREMLAMSKCCWQVNIGGRSHIHIKHQGHVAKCLYSLFC